MRGTTTNALVLIAVLATVVAGCAGPATSTGSLAIGTPGVTATVVVTPSPTATSAPTPSLQATLDQAREDRGAPGAMAALEVDGTRTFLRSGAADTSGTGLTETSRFRIASVTKSITAALVLDAVSRGELGLDDAVGDLLPGVIRPTPAVTVRQLLSHTSGVFDEGNEGDPVADIERLTDPILRHEAQDLLARLVAGDGIVVPDRLMVALAETHPRYVPGYHYSNINYQLAGMVLEQVTGQPLAELLRTRIVEPLGLRQTTLAPADPSSPEMRGYVQTADDDAPVDLTDDLTWFGNGGSGGIISTPDEVLTMLRAIVTAELFPASLVAQMVEPGSGSYALGLGRYDFACGTFYGHGGLVDGTHSIALISADRSDGVVLAFNLSKPGDPDPAIVAETLLCSRLP